MRELILRLINWYVKKSDIVFICKESLSTLKSQLDRLEKKKEELKQDLKKALEERDLYQRMYLTRLAEDNSSYDAVFSLKLKLETANRKYEYLVDTHNALVKRINKLGGQDFLLRAERGENSQFSSDEISQLIKLCHPDKHNCSQTATAITQKLLSMRKKN